MDDRVQHRKVDVLTDALTLAREQCRADRLGQRKGRDFVGDNGSDQDGAAVVGARLDTGQSRQRLDQRVENRLVSIGTGLAKAADRSVNDPWVDFLCLLKAQS